MNESIHFKTVEEGSCDCCQVPAALTDQGSEPYGCAERKIILTHREQRVLKSIRETSLKARRLKDTIHGTAGDRVESDAARAAALAELERLRHLRLDLEKERVAAAHERMVLLGHA